MKNITSICIWLTTVLLSGIGCERQPAIPPASAPARAAARESEAEPEERREITQYGAKHAYSRLCIHLRDHKVGGPQKLWQVIPARTAIYSRGDGESRDLSGVVGGWVFFYRDAERDRQAIVSCWGEVKLIDLKEDYSKNFRGAIDPSRWQVDNIQAHRLVLGRGGEAKSSSFGGWLMAVDVPARGGVRPAWAGGAWFLRKTRQMLAVDAETGEIYVPLDSRLGAVKFQPFVATNAPPTWNGGFDERSTEAIMGRSDEFYLWPFAYRSFGGRHVYNHRALRQALTNELARSSRDAASFFTSGLLRGLLGDWHDGLPDLDKAAALAPKTEVYREAHALACLLVRDLDRATADATLLPEGKTRDGQLEWLKILRGKEESALIGSTRNFDTSAGILPVELHIEDLPFSGRNEE